MKTIEQRLSNPRNRLARFYDDGGKSLDRYTAVYLQRQNGEFAYLGMNAAPFHPQGIGQHGASRSLIDSLPPRIGRSNHLGKRIRFQDLPEDCRKAVLNDLKP